MNNPSARGPRPCCHYLTRLVSLIGLTFLMVYQPNALEALRARPE
jgi:hypothetical protein